MRKFDGGMQAGKRLTMKLNGCSRYSVETKRIEAQL